MANRTLPTLLCAIVTVAAAALSASAADPVPILTGLSSETAYAYAGNLKPGHTVTLEAWVYPTGWRSYSGREKHGLNFMYKGVIGSHIDFVFALQENGILCLGNTRGYIGVHNKRVPASKWSHVAVTINNATGDIRFYINGAYVGQGSGWQGRNPGRVGFISYSTAELDIGGFNQHGWGYNNDNFKGYIADVRIWSVVRTDKQIAENYQRQLSGKEAGLMAYWTFADSKDKTGHGWDLQLRGASKLEARKGPALDTDVPADITASMKAVDPFFKQIGQKINLSASGSSSTGTIAAATFKIASVGGKVVTNIAAKTLSNRGTNFTATLPWTPERSGVYSATLTVTNSKIKASFTTKPAWFVVRGPFLGTPVSLPGTFQAENFNAGKDGTEYHDVTPKNGPGAYRPAERADIAKSASGYVLTNVVAGEWLRYAVSSPAISSGATSAAVASNRFLFSARLSAKGRGGAFSLKPEGSNISSWPAATILVPDTGAWTTFKTVEKAIWLPSKFSSVRVNMDKNGSSGQVACFDWFALKPFRFELAAKSRELSKAAAASKHFSLSANASWSAKTDVPWIKLRTSAGSGNGRVVYDVAANPEADRTGHIIVSCAGTTQIYTVRQKGAGPAFLSLPAKDRTFSKAASQWNQFSIKANFVWAAKTDVAWIKLRTKVGKNSTRIFFDVDANKSADRTGHITVSGFGKSVTYTIIQKGSGPAKLSLLLSGRTLSAGAAAGKQFAVSGNVDWTVSSDASWIKLHAKSGKNAAKITFDVTANTTASKRVGHIYVKSSQARTVTYTVTQNAPAKAAKAVRSAVSCPPAGESGESGGASDAADLDSGSQNLASPAGVDGGALSYPFVEVSDGSDASAILDGDFSTSWSPSDDNGRSLLISLSPDAPVPGEDICVLGDLPAETRIFGAAEDGDWSLVADDAPGTPYSRICIDIPATYGIPFISEVFFDPGLLPPDEGEALLEN